MALRSISRLFGSTQTPGCRSVNGTLALSLVLLAVVLVSATSRRSEVVVAVPAAALLVGIGAVPATVAGSEVLTLLPVVAFLGALLVLVAVCDSDGLFRVFGSWLAHSSPGRPRALLGRVFLVAGATTAVLSLDATVLLLTPVVIGATRLLAVRSRPHTYATVHLANSASLLLPVSNLTNLLAFGATGLSFIRFTVLMAGPWLVAVAVEYVLFRLLFRGDLQDRPATARPAPHESAPLFTLLVLGLTLAGFAVTSVFGVSPAWAAAIGAAVLGGRSLMQGRITVPALFRSVNLPFLMFVLALGIVVRCVLDNGGQTAMSRLLPSNTGLLSLLLIAATAAALSNLVNNLPAILILLVPLSGLGSAAVLAALIGVNIGPNLTYVGSLANLLWRRVLHQRNESTDAAEFSLIGLVTVPASVCASVVTLWAAIQVIGL